jgi:hypothetical protein
MGAADAIGAHIYLQLHERARGAWTNKIDVRPWIEHW